MILENLPVGNDVPNDFNVVIEISMHSPGIKYEIDKHSGAIAVDRFMSTAMHYPCNYGFVPHTLSDDGDPVDVLVIAPYPLPPGVVVRCRPIGLLTMDDEAGGDAKILAVPVDKLTPLYKNVRGLEDLPVGIADQIAHFFAHYKDLEENKWVKVLGWQGVAEAEQELLGGIARFQQAEDKPQF